MVPIVIAGLVASAIAGIFVWRSRSFAGRLFSVLMTLCFLVPSGILLVGMNPWLVDARFRTYKLFYWNLRSGMSRQEVLDTMNRHYPAGAPRQRPFIRQDSASQLDFHMNPEQGAETDHDEISLEMEEGIVIRKSYSHAR